MTPHCLRGSIMPLLDLLKQKANSTQLCLCVLLIATSWTQSWPVITLSKTQESVPSACSVCTAELLGDACVVGGTGALGLSIAPAFARQFFRRAPPMQKQSLSSFCTCWVRYWKFSLQNENSLENRRLSPSQDTVSWHILPPSACSTWTLTSDYHFP